MRIDIEFSLEGRTLRGWLYQPAHHHQSCPAIVMTHGSPLLERADRRRVLAGPRTIIFTGASASLRPRRGNGLHAMTNRVGLTARLARRTATEFIISQEGACPQPSAGASSRARVASSTSLRSCLSSGCLLVCARP